MKKTNIQYQEVISKAKEIFVLKTKDYGTAWRILRPSSLTDQIFIKASRIRSIQEKKAMQINESIEGEFLAIINYCVMAMIQLEKSVVDGNYDMDEETLFEEYDIKVAETKALMEKKNHDYGEAWRDMRISSMTDLILMKLLRIKQIEENEGKTLISEGLDANYQDMLNYAVFALILKYERDN
ncbi:MAG: DUF1599 domain-containing protein [Saprospiraceae bacterium]|nr:DUF1599 domain-containing protein [Bacteroidia bacterium]MBT8230796.1 DUF1599 domain-containing protein [Bacteroidia bacterium]NNF20699.1 DUF1599 domain-containing protein [Saprospiraceae bacterium]NNK89819.1 DUF1599 domain-containing protein [Saprospiraceae bacterium]